MKFLFIVQGEGRGHLTQAITLEEMLRRHGHEVVEVLVGKSPARKLPGFFNRCIHAPVKQFVSPNFLPTPANKQANLLRSIPYNLLKTPAYLHSIHFLHRRIEQSGADVVINFYELLTGLTYLFCRPSVPQVCIGHQYLFLHHDYQFPVGHGFSLTLLRWFTRLTCIGARECLALSFHAMPDDKKRHLRVVPPLLRHEVMTCEPQPGDYIHGYMVNAGFGENVETWHKQHPETPLRFFWDKSEEGAVKQMDPTLSFYQLDDREFLRQMEGCKAYATTAGFESVCEAIYLGKPVLMVPVHIEQECNACEAVRYGAGVKAEDFNLDLLLDFAATYKSSRKFAHWVHRGEYAFLNLLERYASDPSPVWYGNGMHLVEEYV